MMLTQFSLDNQNEMSAWDDFVQSHPLATPFHLSSWLKTISDTYSFEPRLYVYKNADTTISAILPFFLLKIRFAKARLVSLPFSDYGGPLCTHQHTETELLKAISSEHKGLVKSMEIRGTVSGDCGFIHNDYFRRHLLLLQQDLTTLRKRIDKRTIHYSIRKAEKAGIQITEQNNQYGIQEFYRLNILTRKKHGVPSQPCKFFENILHNVIAQGDGFVLLASLHGVVLAAAVFLKTKKTILYKFNASDPSALRKTTPNHLLTWLHSFRSS